MVNLSVPSTVMDRGPQRMVHFMDFKVTRTEQSSWTAVGACQWSRALGRAAPDNGDLVPLYVPFCGHRDLIQKLRTFSILLVFSSVSFAAMSTVISDSFLQSFFCPSGRSWKKSGAPRTDLRLAPINGSFFFSVTVVPVWFCAFSFLPFRLLAGPSGYPRGASRVLSASVWHARADSEAPVAPCGAAACSRRPHGSKKKRQW